MDCRKPVALAFSLLAATAGCSHKAGSVASATSTPVVAAPKQETLDPDALKRAPKPESWVAYGDYSANEAEAATLPAEKEQLRDRARRAYQQALKTDPSSVAAQKSLARLYVITNDYARAKQSYEVALQLAPGDASLWFDLGMTYARLKEWGPAVDHLAHAIELDPENRQYYRYQGFTLARAGRYEESLAAFGRYEGEAKAHFYLAEMLEHMGQLEPCKAHLQVALIKDPQLTAAAKMMVRLSGSTPPGVAEAPAQAPPTVQPVIWTEQVPGPGPAPRPKILPPPPMLPRDIASDPLPSAGM